MVEMLEVMGVANSRMWIYRKIRAGKLSLPKKPFATKRYDLNMDVMEEACLALQDKGEYHFERDSRFYREDNQFKRKKVYYK